MRERSAHEGARWRSATFRPAWRAQTDGRGSAEQLQRLLYVLPLAVRKGGDVSLAELAEEVGVDVATLRADLTAVVERYDYLPADTGADLQVLLEDDHVHVWTKGEFGRPVRLSMREVLAVTLGLRLRSIASGEERAAEREALRQRLEDGLASASTDEILTAFAEPDLGADPTCVRETLGAAARDRRPCVIRYLKPGDDEPEERRIHPHALAHSEGIWYALAHCESARAMRSFRADRAIDIRLEDGPFHEDPTFNPNDHMEPGRVFSGDGDLEAVIRYSPNVARWVAETEDGEWDSDGSLRVRHKVADPGWLVRHVLQYGGEAEVLSPAELRASVREAAAALLARREL